MNPLDTITQRLTEHQFSHSSYVLAEILLSYTNDRPCVLSRVYRLDDEGLQLVMSLICFKRRGRNRGWRLADFDPAIEAAKEVVRLHHGTCGDI